MYEVNKPFSSDFNYPETAGETFNPHLQFTLSNVWISLCFCCLLRNAVHYIGQWPFQIGVE